MAVYKVYIQALGGKQMEQHQLWYPDVAESRDGRRPGEDGKPSLQVVSKFKIVRKEKDVLNGLRGKMISLMQNNKRYKRKLHNSNSFLLFKLVSFQTSKII